MGTVRAFAVVTVLSNTCCFSPFGRVARSTNRRRILRPLLTSAGRSENLAILSVSITGQKRQISRGKFLRLPRTTAGFTFRALDGYGLCCSLPARPTLTPQIRFLYVGSRFGSVLLSDAASRQSPLHFANPSPPSGWIRDLHPQAEKHARHTMQTARPFQAGRSHSVFLVICCQIRRRRNHPEVAVRFHHVRLQESTRTSCQRLDQEVHT